MRGPIPAGRLRPALWGSAAISLLLIGGMLLVRSFGSAVAIMANSRAERASSPSISAARAST